MPPPHPPTSPPPPSPKPRSLPRPLTPLTHTQHHPQDYFVKYYDSCMPLLSSIMTHASDRAHHLLRAKALECVSLVGMAVGKERFRCVCV